MPTFIAGFRGVWKVTDAGSTSRDLSSVTTKLDFPRTVDKLDVTTLSNTYKVYIPGLTDATYSWEAVFDQVTAGYIDAILSAQASGTFQSRAFEYGPAGSTAGLPKYTGTLVVVGFDITSDVTGALKMTASFQNTGAITVGTY